MRPSGSMGFSPEAADGWSNQTGLRVTRAVAAASRLVAPVLSVQTTGYAADGDGGHARYVRVAAQPTHAGKFQSADGSWWEMDERDVDPRAFGAVPDAANADGSDAATFTDSTAAINAALWYASLRGASARPASTSKVDGAWAAGARRVVFRGGLVRQKSVYGVTGRCQVYCGSTVAIERGAEVRAMTGFAKAAAADAVSAVFEGATAIEVAAGAQRVRNVLIEINGNINCNRMADVGIQGHLGNNWDVNAKSGYVLFPKLIGVRFGISTNAESMFECYVDGLWTQFFRTDTDTGGTNDPNSAGVDYAKCTDSVCSRSITIGGRRGFRSQSGDNTFLRCHAWTTPGCGPMVAAFVNFSSGVKFAYCIADGVQSMGGAATIGGSGGKVAAFECYGSAEISNPTLLHSPGAGATAGEANLVYTSISAGQGTVSVTGTVTVKNLNTSPKMGALLNGDQRVIRMSAQLMLLGGADYDRTLGALPLGLTRNAAPNRDFSIWQRGDGPNSCIGTAGQIIRFCDRWWTQTGSTTGVRTLRRKRITDTDTAGVSHASVLTIAQTTDPGDGQYFNLNVTLPPEDLMDAAGKYMTVAFKARLASGAMPNNFGFTAGAYCVYAAGSNASSANSPASAALTSTGAFQLFTLRTLIPSINGLTIDPAVAKLQVGIALPKTGVWEIDIAEMTISFGDVWQDYQVPSRQDVEDEALRYFERVNFRTINGERGVGYRRKAKAPTLSVTPGALIGSWNLSDVVVSHTASANAVLDVLAEL